MKIVLLGAGWLGEPLAHQLQEHAYPVWASTTTAEKARRLKEDGLDVRVVEATPTGLQGQVKDFFAADILVLSLPPGGRRDPDVETSYPAKVAQIIAAAKVGGIQHVLFTSSTGIYGEQEGRVDEQSPLLPVTNSGKALVKVEALLREAYAEQVTILRLAGLNGPDRQAGRWFAGKKEVAEGNRFVNLVHQQDVLNIIQQVITQEAWGHTLNVCSDEHPTKAEFYPLAARQLGLEPPTFAPNIDELSGKWVDNAQAKLLLDFTYKYPDPRQFVN